MESIIHKKKTPIVAFLFSVSESWNLISCLSSSWLSLGFVAGGDGYGIRLSD